MGASPRAKARAGVQHLRGLEVCGLDQLEQQADGGPVRPPDDVCGPEGHRNTSRLNWTPGWVRPGFRLAAPLRSLAFSTLLGESSTGGSH